MGGANWGGHTCPGPGPRAAQRAGIIALAKQIRNPPAIPPKPPAPPVPAWQATALLALDRIGNDVVALQKLIKAQ
jgi:hypothetical protein